MALRILLIDQNGERRATVEQALRAGGDVVIAFGPGAESLLARMRSVQPDLVIVDMDSPDRDMLEQMRAVAREQPRPIVMFVDRSDPDMAREAVRAGVSAYVVDGLAPNRVRPILEVAIARFQAFESLRQELDRTKATLAQRKVIERAKGILMRQRSLSEDEAYKALRSLAMSRNKPLAEIAEQVIAVSELLGSG